MNILVFNCGSSSLKYRLLNAEDQTEIFGGEAQRIGPPTSEPSRIIHRQKGNEVVHTVPMQNHSSAFAEVMNLMGDAGIHAIGHRVAHGGEMFRQPTVIDDFFVEKLDELSNLAPLHNPPIIELIRACRRLYPDLPQVAVFDTAYHMSIPEHAYTYALPKGMREKYGIRKYGFHGTSHAYVAAEAARFLGIELRHLNAVSCHLGSGGASLCAIKQGQSIDNTMGYSPLQGLIMSTRCGDLDPAILMTLLARANGDCEKVDRFLNRNSGVLGLSGESADIRDVLNGPNTIDGPSLSRQTARVYLWRLRKYLGAYLGIVGNPHAVIFTDTIGEEVPQVREALCTGMRAFGLRIDKHANKTVTALPADVAGAESNIRILVVRTNEERAIAGVAYGVLRGTARFHVEASL